MKVMNAVTGNWMPTMDWVLRSRSLSVEDAKRVLAENEIESFIGHESTAAVISSELGLDIPAMRRNATVEVGEVVFVAQYHGPRLAEGTTILPDGASIEYGLVTRLE